MPSGGKSVGPLTITSTTGLDQQITVTLAAGFNTVAVPSNAKAAILIPPVANANTITLKGVTGDTGVALSKLNPSVISFDTTPPATIGLTVGGTVTGLVVVFL